MPLHYARTFAPWILFAAVSGWNGLAGALTGLVAATALLIDDLRRGRTADSVILEISTTAFMVVIASVALAAPGSPLLRFGASMAIGWLAVTAWGTVLVGHPFTEGIARRGVTADIAATGLFKQITRTLAIVWAADFTVMTGVLAYIQQVAHGHTLILIIVKVCGFSIPAVITARYPEGAQKRYFAKHGIDPDEPAPPAPHRPAPPTRNAYWQ